MPGEGRGRIALSPALPAIFRSFARGLELIFFPSFCKICGKLLENPRDRVLCRACVAGLAPHRGPLCPRCGRFFDETVESHLCGACLLSGPPFAIHRSAGRYRGSLKDAILLLKYRRFRPLGTVLGGFVWESLEEESSFWEGLDIVVPVPLHRLRQRDRGFNQAAAVAGEIGRRCGLPVARKALRKVRNAPPQTGLERGGREGNVRGAFAVSDAPRVRGNVVLLVDDVYTTGATLRSCAEALREAGAAEVRAITIAQA